MTTLSFSLLVRWGCEWGFESILILISWFRFYYFIMRTCHFNDSKRDKTKAFRFGRHLPKNISLSFQYFVSASLFFPFDSSVPFGKSWSLWFLLEISILFSIKRYDFFQRVICIFSFILPYEINSCLVSIHQFLFFFFIFKRRKGYTVRVI